MAMYACCLPGSFQIQKNLLVEMAGKFKYFGQNGQNGQAKKRTL
jgi:hypothetical protein